MKFSFGITTYKSVKVRSNTHRRLFFVREQATPRARQPWLAGRENFVIKVDKVRMHAASVGGRFVQQSSRKPTYARNKHVLW